MLDSVSFIKPIGLENEHPGYTSEVRGSDHLVQLLRSIDESTCAKDTMVIVTYDEFGGQWDHVSPPARVQRQGRTTNGARARGSDADPCEAPAGKFVVDSTQYDTHPSSPRSSTATVWRR